MMGTAVYPGFAVISTGKSGTRHASSEFSGLVIMLSPKRLVTKIVGTFRASSTKLSGSDGRLDGRVHDHMIGPDLDSPRVQGRAEVVRLREE